MSDRDKMFPRACKTQTVRARSPAQSASCLRDLLASPPRLIGAPALRPTMPSKAPGAHKGSLALADAPQHASRWWHCVTMRRVSFALFLLAVQAALLSACLSPRLFTSASGAAPGGARAVAFPDLYEASIAELQEGLAKGLFSSEDLVKVRARST